MWWAQNATHTFIRKDALAENVDQISRVLQVTSILKASFQPAIHPVLPGGRPAIQCPRIRRKYLIVSFRLSNRLPWLSLKAIMQQSSQNFLLRAFKTHYL